MSRLDDNSAPPFLRGDNIDLAWDSSREDFFLGGLLTVRAEIQLLRSCFGQKPVRLFSEAEAYGKSGRLVNAILGDIPDIQFINESTSLLQTWPHSENQNDPYFSHGSFFRLPGLIKKSGQRPFLSWTENIRAETKAKLAPLVGQKVTTIHLKNVPNIPPDESNADQNAWKQFFEQCLTREDTRFLLVGSDTVDRNILDLPNVRHSSEFGLTLTEQCAAISLSSGFLGMASGFCQAAVFEDLPYVVFKNPPHHAEQMDAELGGEDFFPFAKDNQKLWRKWDTRENLTSALELILHE